MAFTRSQNHSGRVRALLQALTRGSVQPLTTSDETMTLLLPTVALAAMVLQFKIENLVTVSRSMSQI